MTDSLWMLSRIGYGHRARGEKAPKGNSTQAQSFDNRIKVEFMALQRIGSRGSLREAAATAIVVDHLHLFRQALVEIRAPLPVELDMVKRDPRQQHQRLSLAQRPVGYAHAVARLRVLDARLHHCRSVRPEPVEGLRSPSTTAQTRTGSPTPLSDCSPRSSNATPADVRASERTVSHTSTSPGAESPDMREAMFTAPPY